MEYKKNMYGERIKDLRKKNKLTQEQLAQKIGTTQKTISKYETEALDLNTDTIIKLCEIFKESADYILGIEQEDGTKTYIEEFTYSDGTRNIKYKRSNNK